MTEIAFYVLGDFPASIHRHDEMGHLCGYLGIPPSHPWYGKDYDNIEAQVHGGLTFVGYEKIALRPNPARVQWLIHNQEGEVPARFIDIPRDKPFPHDTGLDIWWVGFDCAHASDKVPGLGSFWGGTYRDERYVREELSKLCSQAAEVMNQEAKV